MLTYAKTSVSITYYVQYIYSMYIYLCNYIDHLQHYDEGRISVHEYDPRSGTFVESLSVFGSEVAARSELPESSLLSFFS